MAQPFATVDDYIASFPAPVQEVLQELRRTILDTAPHLAESISYGMPTMSLDGKPVVFFAGWKHHVSLYPLPAGDAEFSRDVAPYLAAKGTVKFPLDKAVPLELVARIVTLLVERARGE
ncbi:iron chaperone [Specibacter cremeus]|uniref:iron chaperone n=1 Tax=Specibacter cremeus TaxID=1629051 RepID=UPI000F7AB8A2|nr:DUF1801 domain-containing protein [Specibacter cremeus]